MPRTFTLMLPVIFAALVVFSAEDLFADDSGKLSNGSERYRDLSALAAESLIAPASPVPEDDYGAYAPFSGSAFTGYRVYTGDYRDYFSNSYEFGVSVCWQDRAPKWLSFMPDAEIRILYGWGDVDEVKGELPLIPAKMGDGDYDFFELDAGVLRRFTGEVESSFYGYARAGLSVAYITWDWDFRRVVAAPTWIPKHRFSGEDFAFGSYLGGGAVVNLFGYADLDIGLNLNYLSGNKLRSAFHDSLFSIELTLGLYWEF